MFFKMMEAIGSKRGRSLRATQHKPPFSLPLFHECRPKPFRLSLKREVTNFIYTLVKSSAKSLSFRAANDFLEIYSDVAVKIFLFDCQPGQCHLHVLRCLLFTNTFNFPIRAALDQEHHVFTSHLVFQPLTLKTTAKIIK